MSRQWRSETGRFKKGHIPANKGCSLIGSVCKYCSKEFQFNKNYSGGKYCSKDCYILFRKQPGFKIPNSNKFKKGEKSWNNGMDTSVSKECSECGANFRVPKFRKDTAFYCSKKCKAQNKRLETSLQQRGIKKEFWDEKIADGYELVTPKDKLERKRFRNEIQKLVLERDNYTCQMCDKRGGKLQVDHIQSWAEYVELRFDINNCRTLCMACHYKITFGRELPEGVTTWGHNLSQIGG